MFPTVVAGPPPARTCLVERRPPLRFVTHRWIEHAAERFQHLACQLLDELGAALRTPVRRQNLIRGSRRALIDVIHTSEDGSHPDR